MSLDVALPGAYVEPVIAKPKSAPRVASGFLEAVIVDVIRPVDNEFQVRIYDEDFRPPDAEVKLAFVFYGIGMTAVVKALEDSWSRRKIEPIGTLPGGSLRRYDFAGGLREVIESIDSLQRKHMPQ